MTIYAQAIVYRSPTRVRVLFSDVLGSGAFSTSWFTFTSMDDLGAAPLVVAALIVPSSPNTVELALNPPLVPAASYQFTIAAGVPAADTSTAPSAVFAFATPIPRQDPSAALALDDIDALVFGEDLVWSTGDFAEAPDWDLEVVSGIGNAMAAIRRRAVTDGLPHRRDFGARLRSFVDAPEGALPVAAARLNREIRRDDRVVNSTTTASNAGGGEMHLESDIQFVGRQKQTIAHTST